MRLPQERLEMGDDGETAMESSKKNAAHFRGEMQRILGEDEGWREECKDNTIPNKSKRSSQEMRPLNHTE